MAMYMQLLVFLSTLVSCQQIGEFSPPTKWDIRSPCPAFNTMANHGYFPRSGSEIPAQQIVDVFREQFSLDPELSNLLISKAYLLNIGNPIKETIRLDQLRLHNAMEHDSSLVHNDFYFGPHYIVNQTLVDGLINSSKDGKYLTTNDIGEFRKERYDDSKRNNPTFDFSYIRQVATFGESGVMYAIFGNDKGIPNEYIRSFLGENRLPKEFTPKKSLVGQKTTENFAYIIAWASS
ncbi:Chloroperoxidase [Globomyces pollinis-pini]|nr:Chloroperoxidase [Globomyces pollinis-pini]